MDKNKNRILLKEIKELEDQIEKIKIQNSILKLKNQKKKILLNEE